MDTNAEQTLRLVQEQYGAYGVDVEAAMARLDGLPLSIHCWQGDDVSGFENPGAPLTGGIQTTGNYPGKARNPEELRQDMEKMLGYVPGLNRISLHATYHEGGRVERDAIEGRHFDGWIGWAKQNGVALDFNPTFFSHPLSEAGYTLASRDAKISRFWIEHGKRSEEIAEYIGEKLGSPCVNDIWIPDGEKEVPVDTLAPRQRLAGALDEILGAQDASRRRHHETAVESKLFGIGSEAYVVGSHEFYMGYAMSRDTVLTLDMGHFHPTETVSSKLSALLLFVKQGLLLHVSRPVRWDSDHVVAFDDETRAVMREIERLNAWDTVRLATDYFDASINRVMAWAIGARNTKKAMLEALLQPVETLRKLEREGDNSTRLALTEELKALPHGLVWELYCQRKGVPGGAAWMRDAKQYERDVLSKRR